MKKKTCCLRIENVPEIQGNLNASEIHFSESPSIKLKPFIAAVVLGLNDMYPDGNFTATFETIETEVFN